MSKTARRTALLIAAIVSISALLAAAMLYPYLPGKFDPMAFGISTLAQLVGVMGVPVALAALPWLIYEVYKANQERKGATIKPRRFVFALLALVVGAFFLLVATIGAWALAEARALGAALLLTWLGALWFVLPWLLRERRHEGNGFSSAPLLIVAIPVATLLLQLAFGEAANTASRERAIAASAQLIEEIEAWHGEHGSYPETLVSMHKDYQTNVVGIDRFQYAPNGAGYDLIFENPRFVLHNFGAREMVVYNPLDQHRILSHAAWHLAWSPEVAATRQGWFVDFDAGAPHWKYFLFD